MDRKVLERLLTTEMNEEKFGGNIDKYYRWMRQMESVTPGYKFYYIGDEEVPNDEVFSVLDEMLKKKCSILSMSDMPKTALIKRSR